MDYLLVKILNLYCKVEDQTIWMCIRRDYCNLSELCAIADDMLGDIIAVNFTGSMLSSIIYTDLALR